MQKSTVVLLLKGFIMRQWKKVSLAVVFTAVLASCGGGGGSDLPPSTPFKFTQMITFGDSLSDVGTYKVGTIAQVGGGQFTVNSATAKNWTELLAAKYGLPAPCAAQTGFTPVNGIGITGAVIVNNSACKNYAQGSGRVTNVYGPNSKAIQDFVFAANGGTANAAAATAAAAKAAGLGLIALPVFNQINNHLAVAPGGVFSPRELVVVLAGGNDVFLNLNGVSNAAAGGAGAGGAALLAGWTTAQQQAVAGGGAAAVAAAQVAAGQSMAKAGTELATYIKTLIVAKGAKFVAVVNLPDVGQTPFAKSLDLVAPGTSGFVNQLATAFNSAVATGLAGVPEVTIVDAYTQGRAQVASPSAFGLTNVDTPACAVGAAATSGNPLGNDADPATFTAAGGPSITCTTASTLGVKAGTPTDVSKYQFADDVHLSPYGNVLLADFVYGRLSAAGFPN